ncbi:ABC transporter ATP-binding protein [Megalodesulfovibrio gigas]|uniref:Putative phosphonate-transporting ATPase n=1 Tax=Megalodesulfovibrio gigas (strain ATCC 19364 / DSM 1382 / NCIMB 9332 / VKM B-1759) TaxID=1121448 RepID=T2G8N5_MEGG1|nr:ABC transporter ATP-binding protein [Megalodesulfovibrio gigas]AGW12539.1 putative phosphonate-transporting ATPase [Megalodesulfovibrio gigas DSM 1382 = ATCC 19364]
MIVQADAVSFSYAKRPVLQEVSFHADPGELVAILGPNGAGKTTLLKCINAMHRPDAGAVLVEDGNVLRMSAAEVARRVGYVAQRSDAARLTVFDAVLLGRLPHLRWKAGPRDVQLVEEVLTRLRLGGMALRHIDTLSGGELQQVCVARALVQEPRLLLLDEPTSSLDLKNQLEIMRLVRGVVDEHQVAAVLTMHDLNAALRFADKAVFLKGGRVLAVLGVRDITADVVEAVYGVPVIIQQVGGVPMVAPCL